MSNCFCSEVSCSAERLLWIVHRLLEADSPDPGLFVLLVEVERLDLLSDAHDCHCDGLVNGRRPGSSDSAPPNPTNGAPGAANH